MDTCDVAESMGYGEEQLLMGRDAMPLDAMQMIGAVELASIELKTSANRFDSDEISLLSIDDSLTGSATSSARRKRGQGEWHESINPKSARKSYRKALGHALHTDNANAREFQAKLFRTIEDSQGDSLMRMTKESQVEFIRIAINDASSCYIESWEGERNKKVSREAIFDDTIRYAKFTTTLIRQPLIDTSEKWVKHLFQKSMHAFIKADMYNVTLVATATLTLVMSFISASESYTSDLIFQTWKLNIYRICTEIASHRNTSSDCPYIELQKVNDTVSPKVEFLFNSLIVSLIHLNPESHVVKYSFLLTAVVHASVLSDCSYIVNRSTYALLAMCSKLHKFKLVNMQPVRALCDHARSGDRTHSPKLVKLVADIETMANEMQFKRGDRKFDCDPLARASLSLAFELAQEDDTSHYEVDIRDLMASVKMLRSSPFSINEQCYQTNGITQKMPTPVMLHEWTRALQNEWTVFLRDVCIECQSDKDTENFFNSFTALVKMDHRTAVRLLEPGNGTKSFAFKLVSHLLDGQRTSLKLFHNTLIVQARARRNSISLFGLAMPMFDLVTRPTDPSDA